MKAEILHLVVAQKIAGLTLVIYRERPSYLLEIFATGSLVRRLSNIYAHTVELRFTLESEEEKKEQWLYMEDHGMCMHGQ